MLSCYVDTDLIVYPSMSQLYFSHQELLRFTNEDISLKT